jgi:hypothetical protein
MATATRGHSVVERRDPARKVVEEFSNERQR